MNYADIGSTFAEKIAGRKLAEIISPSPAMRRMVSEIQF
jgi:hypothetical protein